MLTRLSVKNLAVVADAVLDFAPGLTVVTGETGAGKSLLIGALSLAVGARASSERVRDGGAAARVEAVFEPDDPDRVNRLLSDLGLEPLEDGLVILRREIGADGRSRAFAGDSQVLVSTLRTLGDALVDLHGQGEGQALLRPAAQRHALDALGGSRAEVHALGAALDAAEAVERDIEARAQRHAEIARQREFFEHQLNEIDGARLSADEEDELLRERTRMRAASRLAELRETVARELDDDEHGAIGAVARAGDGVGELARIDDTFAPLAEMLETARLEIEEVARSIDTGLADLEFSPERRDEVEARLDRIAALKRKYRPSIPAVLEYAEELRAVLAGDEAGTVELADLERRRDEHRRAAAELADRVGETRVRAAAELAHAVTGALPELGMEGARFDVALDVQADPDSWYLRGGAGVGLTRSGAERVTFRLAANPGAPLRPLATVASGGELSRVMLALKEKLAEAHPVDVMVFDEVDSGIGGGTAHAVGDRLRALSGTRQVIAITHLPAVACTGDTHYRIDKRTDGHTTEVTVSALAGRDRVGEIARMLSGAEDDRTARRHARELLEARTGRAAT